MWQGPWQSPASALASDALLLPIQADRADPVLPSATRPCSSNPTRLKTHASARWSQEPLIAVIRTAQIARSGAAPLVHAREADVPSARGRWEGKGPPRRTGTPAGEPGGTERAHLGGPPRSVRAGQLGKRGQSTGGAVPTAARR